MIVVTGATGVLGGLVVERLLERVPADEVGVSVRDPDRVSALAERGVRVRRGDYGDPASLAESFAGAEQVLLVSAPVIGEAGLRLHRVVIDAARAAGVRRIVYTSHMGASPASLFPPMHNHAATEAMLAESGLAWTSLRNGFYASSGVQMCGGALDTGELTAPADGPVSWTAHPDLGEAAAIVLADEGRFDGPTPPLTAARAVDLAGLAEAAGRPVRRAVVTDARYRADLVGHGVPDDRVAVAVGFFAASRAGEFAAVDPTLQRLLGRPPLTVGEALR